MKTIVGRRILLIGAGAREHALAWKLAQDERVTHIYVFPSNAGIDQLPKVNRLPTPVELSANYLAHDLDLIVQCAQSQQIDFAVIGPEVPLIAGLADRLWAAGIQTFGVRQASAQLEASKAFAKEFMRSAGIPHAQDMICYSLEEAKAALQTTPFLQPACAVKYDGLAAGKGVVVCQNQDEALAALDSLFASYGSDPDQFCVVLEECLSGKEVSLLAFCDGQSAVMMPTVRDHKRLLDNDAGPNTGGMGVFAPVPDVDAATLKAIEAQVLQPFLAELARRNMQYCGVIFFGLMWDAAGHFRVLEFNCRFGDPETQVLLPLLQTSLLTVIDACCRQQLAQITVSFSNDSAVGVVLASQGYPDAPLLEQAIHLPAGLPIDTLLFHAATRWQNKISAAEPNNRLVTSGGRVFTCVATDPQLALARSRAYQLAQDVAFAGKQFRTDIGPPS